MLRFFRTLRQRLLTENRFRKYLLYAVGEILLVVVGILIALQINNWSEYRKDRQVEKEILQDLIQNLELHSATLKADIELLKSYNHSAAIAIAVLDKRLPFADSLATHFHRARVPKVELSLSQAGFEQYKNKGFDIILNAGIREEVINYFESSLPRWIKAYDPVNYLNEAFFDYHVPLFRYKDQTLTPVDMESLYTDRYFSGWLRAYMEGRNTLIQMEEELMEEIQRVLQHMKAETEKNNE